MDTRPELKVEITRPSRDHAVVVLEGELNIFTTSLLNAVFLRSIDEGASRVLVDLGKVTVIDSTGLGALVSCAKRLLGADGALDVVCPNESIRRLLEASGLDRILGVYPSCHETL